jgi:hypothetical protein
MFRLAVRSAFVVGLFFALLHPVQAYDSPYWLGEYFTNRDLSGAPAQLRAVAVIDFDWGRAAPVAGLPADGFSVRWTRPVELARGVYRIAVRADDGVRVYIDDRLVLDDWRDGPARTADVDVALGGAHLLRVEYYENADVAAVSFSMTRIDVPTPAPDAWHVEYFGNAALTGAPLVVREEDGHARSGIDYDFGAGSPDPRIPRDEFSGRWTRRLHFVAGYYRVSARFDDGVRVYIGDRLVLDDWREGPLRVVESPALFLAGDVPVRIEYFERAGGAAVRVDFTPTNPGSVTTPTPASPALWRGEYFGNAALAGSPALVRSDRAVDFDWGQGPVAQGLPADEFSARWSRRVRFAPGSYRFRVRVDDGVRVYLDGRLLLDEWREGPPRTVSADVRLSGSADVRVEYFDRGGGALVQLSYERIDRAFPDWRAEYYTGIDFTGTPLLVRNDSLVNFDWGAGAPAPWLPADDFAVRWTRARYFPTAGWHRFTATVDDGMRVFIDGTLVIDQWREGAVRTVDRVIWLDAGRHDLRVEYFERAGGAIARFVLDPAPAPTMTLAP